MSYLFVADCSPLNGLVNSLRDKVSVAGSPTYQDFWTFTQEIRGWGCRETELFRS